MSTIQNSIGIPFRPIRHTSVTDVREYIVRKKLIEFSEPCLQGYYFSLHRWVVKFIIQKTPFLTKCNLLTLWPLHNHPSFTAPNRLISSVKWETFWSGLCCSIRNGWTGIVLLFLNNVICFACFPAFFCGYILNMSCDDGARLSIEWT